jgi:RNA polymerase sigma-70 factor, ECF subfamily
VQRTATNNPDDFALMQGIAAGDQAALGALYDRHSGLVFTLAQRILHDRMAAEDLLMDVFWEIWSRGDRYDPTRGSPISYLMTLARSRAIDRRRSSAKHSRVRTGSEPFDGPIPTAEFTGPETNAIAGELGERVRAAMSKLDVTQRQAVELSFFDDLSHSQIAERLGKPLGTVKTNIRQGLIHLRQCMRMDS